MLYLAPIQGFTEHIFRNVFHQHFGGIDIAIAPFITLVKGKRVNMNHLQDLWPENNKCLKIIPQVIGNEPDLFIMMARDLQQLGYESVNWNLGCPKPQVTKKQRGSGLLPYPDQIREILEEVLASVRINISVKTRLGLASPDEFDKLVPVFNRFNLEYLVIHPRLGIQMYDGRVNLEKLDGLLPQIRQKVIYSGDINSLPDYKKLKKRYPAINDWMLGRGLISNPFLAEEIMGFPQQTAHDREVRFGNFHNDLFEALSEKSVKEKSFVNKIKEYWKSFSAMFVEEDAVFNFIKTAQSGDELMEKINGVFVDFRFKE